jgi:citrate synthase
MSGRRASAYITAREAVTLLGVKPATLYSYVSRGLLRAIGERQGRRYALDDVLRLKARHDARSGHGPVAAGALRWGEAVLETRISDVSSGVPRYRGHDAIALAASGVAFERVCELLWSGVLPDACGWPREEGQWWARLRALGGAGRDALDRVRVGVAVLSGWDDARAAVRRIAGLVAPWEGDALRPCAEEPSVARAVVRALTGAVGDEQVAAVDRALVLCADHELNPSTFTARVAASAGADLGACLLAALATHTGRLHGRMSDAVEGAAETLTPADVAAQKQRGEGLAGFGHPLYPAGDPRAKMLLGMAEAAGRTRWQKLAALIDAAHDSGMEAPNLDVGLTALRMAFGLPKGAAAALFAVGRSGGWIAHAVEQREAGVVLRPRARYVGA